MTGNAGRQAWLNAQAADPFTGHQPELIIALPGPSVPPPQPLDGETLEVGRRVRVLRGPEVGKVGTVSSLSPRPLVMPSGLRAMTASVALEGGAGPSARVAVANLEILE